MTDLRHFEGWVSHDVAIKGMLHSVVILFAFILQLN